jgi:sugar/nucleoside kinase (ribokinase family)
MRPFDLLVAGEINPDLVLSGNVLPEFGQVEKLVDSATLTIGSSSAIFACGAARLGLKVAFVGLCGDDVFGRFMLDEMQKRNVDVSNVIIHPDGQTGLSVILTQDTDRAILTHLGLITGLQASDISDSLLCQSRHLHVASYFLQTKLQPDLPSLYQRARSLGLTTKRFQLRNQTMQNRLPGSLPVKASLSPSNLARMAPLSAVKMLLSDLHPFQSM